MITRRAFLKMTGLTALAGVGLTSYAFAIEPRFRLAVTHYRLTPPGWPAGQPPGTIAAIADPHAVEPWMPVSRLEEIAAVDGVDGVFIGPSDLSASMGHLGNPAAAEVQDAIRAAAGRIAAAGKVPGILATRAQDAIRYRDWGYRFIAGGVDTSLLVGAARALLASLTDGE